MPQFVCTSCHPWLLMNGLGIFKLTPVKVVIVSFATCFRSWEIVVRNANFANIMQIQYKTFECVKIVKLY